MQRLFVVEKQSLLTDISWVFLGFSFGHDCVQVIVLMPTHDLDPGSAEYIQSRGKNAGQMLSRWIRNLHFFEFLDGSADSVRGAHQRLKRARLEARMGRVPVHDRTTSPSLTLLPFTPPLLRYILR